MFVVGGLFAALNSCTATGHARWIAGGTAITIVCVVALSLLVGMQETALN